MKSRHIIVFTLFLLCLGAMVATAQIRVPTPNIPTGVVAQELNCTDGIDNDNDGDVDCADSNCSNKEHCINTILVCANGVDDDGDGLTDCDDNDCEFTWPCAGWGGFNEAGFVNGCTDGLDNDGNGLTDCNDTDCANAEHCTPGVLVCNNNVDDDNDGLTDCDDDDCVNTWPCSGPIVLNEAGFPNGCTDGLDNNGNGLTDCDDPNCANDPAC